MSQKLSVVGLKKAFGETQVLDELSFEIEAGQTIGLLGPSGCGKTTALRIIAGLEQPDQGEVSLGGRALGALPPEKRQVGVVFQEFALFPHLSALENICFGPLVAKKSKSEAREIALKYLEQVGLMAHAEKKPSQLSGGQQQRIALARALAAAPQCLLLDEPFGSLDPGLRQQLRSEVQKLLSQNQLTTVMVSHDAEDVFALCDWVAVMDQGQVQQLGAPREVYLRPNGLQVAQALGTINTVPKQSPLLNQGQEQACYQNQDTLGFRPEALQIVVDDKSEHICQSAHFHGSFTQVQLEHPQGSQEFTVASVPAQVVGKRVRLQAIAS